jgi:phenylalanyl-tRNA synthetase beta chain
VRVPLSWLREYVDWEWTAEELAERLTGLGLAVEAVERTGVAAERIASVGPLPGSDRLSVCRLSGGAPGVYGAPGLRAGLAVAWARPGAELPGGRTVGRAAFLGVESEGMLCSAAELGLPGGGERLLDVDDPRLAAALDDVVLVLELTPNYAVHCQSLIGVAREVGALLGRPARRPPAGVAEAPRQAADEASVRVADAELCPLYVARVVEGLSAGPSPLWMARRLQLAGMRPIGGVVDVTNYVMLESGQPLHAFDLARLRGGRVAVRRALPGERLVTLDGVERALEPSDLVIADGERAVALAGVMGGADAEVTESTRAVLLESAVFAPDAVSRAVRRLGLRSEASSRFSRGVDPETTRWAADRAAGLLAELCGGRVLAGAAEVGSVPRRRAVTLRGSVVRQHLGVALSTAESGHLLERLGFGVAADGADRLRVTIPGWRGDVAAEVDLVEEVARLHGYERIPELLPPGASGTGEAGALGPAVAAARQAVLAAGFSEGVTYSFHARSAWDRLRLPGDHPWRRAVAVANPMTEDQAVLRRSLAPGLLDALSYNARHRRADAALFEVGRVFAPDPGSETGVRETAALGLAGFGRLGASGWAGPGRPLDFFGLKGVLELLLERLRIAGWTAERAHDLPFLHPGRAARLLLAGEPVAWLGEVHPTVAQAWDLPERAVAGEVDLEALAARARLEVTFRPWPRSPAVRRDVAFVLDEAVPAGRAAEVIRAAAGPLLAGLELFDVYAGEGVPAGRRSLAYALHYQDREGRTLTDAEVDGRQAAVRAALAERLGATLRS